MTIAATAFVDVGVASRLLEDELGDGYVAEPFAGGILLAAIDGIGHGREAAAAARLAEAAISARPGDAPAAVLDRCHKALRGSRGAVASLARIGASGTLTWIGVGNVEGALLSGSGAPIRLLGARGGVLGHTLPALRSDELRLGRGDTVVLATDGIRTASIPRAGGVVRAQVMAERILAEGRKGTDDALVLVARIRSVS